MSPLRVLVVDDERPARAKIVRLVAGDPRFEIAGEARDGVEALERIEALRPDVVVLDIQMPGASGFEVLEALSATGAREVDFAVVFSTAYDAHALRAFDAHAVDYLLKPYDAARFRKAMDKAYAQRCGHGAASPRFDPVGALVRAGVGSERRRLTVKTVDGPWVTLATAAILRVSAANKHTCIVLREVQHLVRLPLRDLGARLGPGFVQTHRSEFVNLDAVARVEPWSHGDGFVVLDDGSTLVLTRTYRRAFLAAFERER